jgi:sugar transferase (PEP-CTERM/EpsH1 system associated)
MKTDTRPLILHVVHHLVTGGMENGVVNLINSLPESRFRHAVACIENYSDFRERLVRPDVDVFALHRSRIGVWRLRAEIFRLCRQLHPTLVHSRNMSGLDALLPARAAGVRHAIHGEHGWDVDNLNGEKWKPALLRQIHSPLIDRYVTVSRDLERYLVARVRIQPHRISQIYNGVDTKRFAPTPQKPVGIMPTGFAGEDTLVIGTVGRLQPVKDQATLVRAFAELVDHHPALGAKLRLAIVGDGPLLADLQALAEGLGIGRQTWFPGAQTNIADTLRSFDIFVLPSLSEGISNTILEAMASGLPVLATAAGGNVELVEDRRSGRLFFPGDVRSLTRFLLKYAMDMALRREHGFAARRIAVERFSLDKMVGEYQSLYEAFCYRSSEFPAESSDSQATTNNL